MSLPLLPLSEWAEFRCAWLGLPTRLQTVCRLTRKIISNVGRYQVLTKTPKSKEIADTDVFAFNNKFTDRQRKIKMSLLVTKVKC